MSVRKRTTFRLTISLPSTWKTVLDSTRQSKMMLMVIYLMEKFMSIMDKLKKNSKIKTTEVLQESKFFTEKDMVATDVPMVNVALSGSIDGGVTPGLTVLAGPSKHFKTSFALLMAGAYLKEKKDAVMLFYDSEFGSPQSYFEQFGIAPAESYTHLSPMSRNSSLT